MHDLNIRVFISVSRLRSTYRGQWILARPKHVSLQIKIARNGPNSRFFLTFAVLALFSSISFVCSRCKFTFSSVAMCMISSIDIDTIVGWTGEKIESFRNFYIFVCGLNRDCSMKL